VARRRVEVAVIVVGAAALAIPVAGGAAAADGVEDQAAEHAEVAAGGGIFGGVAVVESDGSDVVLMTLCHSPATYIAEKNTAETEREKKKRKVKSLFSNLYKKVIFLSLIYFQSALSN